jgi:hypothetical protein
MHICVTEVDKDTKVPCTVEPQRTGPSMPNVKGLVITWADKSTWPVELSPSGTYLRAPKYYGTCDDDADTNIAGVLEVLTEQDFLERKETERLALEAQILANKPFASWVWNETEQMWRPPFPRPADAVINGGTVRYRWDEDTVNWIPLEN